MNRFFLTRTFLEPNFLNLQFSWTQNFFEPCLLSNSRTRPRLKSRSWLCFTPVTRTRTRTPTTKTYQKDVNYRSEIYYIDSTYKKRLGDNCQVDICPCNFCPWDKCTFPKKCFVHKIIPFKKNVSKKFLVKKCWSQKKLFMFNCFIFIKKEPFASPT